METTAQTGLTRRTRPGGRKRIETVVETLAALRSRGETLSEVAHDARNMVTALGLYCDLLEEPGVLATPFLHYATELRLVASASRRLVEKLVSLDAGALPSPAAPASGDMQSWYVKTGTAALTGSRHQSEDRNRRWDLLPAVPVANLAAELMANRNLLSALAGPAIALTIEAEGGAQPVRLTGEDLTRILVNLIKNAAEAMTTRANPAAGRIRIGLSEKAAQNGTAKCLLVTIEDNGPGIAEQALHSIFQSGFTTHNLENGQAERAESGWPLRHRGLGLAITRSIVEGAGGRIAARNRAQGGALFEIELPVRQTGYELSTDH